MKKNRSAQTAMLMLDGACTSWSRKHRARGAGHQAALRALDFKWVRILFRCWQTGERYDEMRYLKTLARRGSPAVLPSEKSTTQP